MRRIAGAAAAVVAVAVFVGLVATRLNDGTNDDRSAQDGGDAPTTPAGLTGATAPAADGGILLDARGGYTGGRDVRTEAFSLTARRQVELCWEVADPEDLAPGFRAFMTLFIYEREPSGDFSPASASALFSADLVFLRDNECRRSVNSVLPPGTYAITVTSFFRSWRVIVRAVETRRSTSLTPTTGLEART